MNKKILAGLIILSSAIIAHPGIAANEKVQKDNAVINPANKTRDYTDRIIVKFKSEKPAADRSIKPQIRNLQNSQNISLQYLRNTAGDSQVYSLGNLLKLAEVKAIAAEIMLRADVEYAEPDARRFPAFTPNDTAFVDQWYLYESAGGIRAEQAWDITRGNTSTVVAIIDSGILSHSDLSSSRLLPGYDFVSPDAPGVFATANDGNGRDNDPSDPGDFVTDAESTTVGGPLEDCDVADSSWHGTLVTGIIVASTDNGSGIAGIDHNALAIPIRALGKCGGYISDITDAIRWASGETVSGVPANANPADVINLSLGGAGDCSTTEQNAINVALANNAVIVVAAGNESGQASNSAPGNCNNVINVAATSRQGAETEYTNIGPQVDISAPGGSDSGGVNGILVISNSGATTPSTEAFAYAIGTSLSAPIVAGAAALLKGLSPTATHAQIEELLKITARPFPTGTADGFGDCNTLRCGAGILDLQAAVIAGSDISPDAFSFPDVTNTPTGIFVSSAAATIAGIHLPVAVSIVNGQYSIDGGAFTATNGAIGPGQSIIARVLTSTSLATTTSATLTVGDFSIDFDVTTSATAITTPDPFSFTDAPAVFPGTSVLSNTVTITGITVPTVISIVNGEYSIDGGEFTSAAGLINSGQTVVVRATASPNHASATTATLTVGDFSADFNITSHSPFIGSGGGSMFWLLPLLIAACLFRYRNKKTSYR